MYLFRTFLVHIIGNNQVNLIRSATFSCLVCVFHLFVKSTWLNMFRYIFDTFVSFEWPFCSTPKFHLVRYLFHLLCLFCTFLSSQEMFLFVNRLSKTAPLRHLFHILYMSRMVLKKWQNINDLVKYKTQQNKEDRPDSFSSKNKDNFKQNTNTRTISKIVTRAIAIGNPTAIIWQQTEDMHHCQNCQEN